MPERNPLTRVDLAPDLAECVSCGRPYSPDHKCMPGAVANRDASLKSDRDGPPVRPLAERMKDGYSRMNDPYGDDEVEVFNV